MGSKKVIKRMVSLMCAVILCMSYTMSAYAAAYSVSAPRVSVTSNTTVIVRSITGSMSSTQATWLMVKHYFMYVPRGYSSEVKSIVKSHGTGSTRVLRVEGTSSFKEAVDSHNTYTKAYNEGWYGKNSSEYLFYDNVGISFN